MTFHINLPICAHEFDRDIGPGLFDLEAPQYGIIRSSRPVNQWFGMSMKVRLLSVLAGAACALASCTGRPGDGREAGSDKAEWSILQSLEEHHRDYPWHALEFIEVYGYHFVCLPRDGDQKRIWIMLDPRSPPFYKQLPSGNYWLTAEQIEIIRKKANPISTVLEALGSHKRVI